MFSSVFENTADELRRLVRAGKGASLENEGVISYCEVHASQEEIDRIRQDLENILARIRDLCDEEEESAEGKRRYRLTTVFFPLVG